MNTRLVQHLALPILFIVTSATLSACGSQRRGAPLTEPLVITDPTIERGQIVFMEHCNQCHPGGAGGLAPAINDKPLPQMLIKTQIRAGLGAMPAFPEDHLSDEQVDSIVAYLKQLRTLDSRG